jgi:hypothetical protein
MGYNEVKTKLEFDEEMGIPPVPCIKFFTSELNIPIHNMNTGLVI